MHTQLAKTQKKTAFFTSPNATFVILVGILLLSGVVFYRFPPIAYDWIVTFYPVSHHLEDPYQVTSFVNLPWTVIALAPFRFLPLENSIILNASLHMAVFWLLAKKFNGIALSSLLTLTSYPVLSSIAMGQIEWLPALGLIMAGSFGFILILTKPQSGMLAGIYWFMRHNHKIRFALAVLLWTGLSILLWPGWPLRLLTNFNNLPIKAWNASLFPWLVPVGLYLVFHIIKFKPANGSLLGAWPRSAFHRILPRIPWQSHSPCSARGIPNSPS